jgi:hypothetical protein
MHDEVGSDAPVGPPAINASQLALPGTELVPYRVPTPVTDTAQRLTRAGFGMLGIAGGVVRGIVSTVAHSGNGSAANRPERSASTLTALPGALLGIGIAAEETVFEISGAIERRVVQVRRSLRHQRPRDMRPHPSYVDPRVERWREYAQLEQARNVAFVTDTASRLVPELAEAIVARVNIGRIVAAIPIEDMMAQIDFNAILQNLDIGRIVQQVVADVDIAAVVRESTSSIGDDAVDVVRVQSIAADQAIERIVDRVLRRSKTRGTTVVPEGAS